MQKLAVNSKLISAVYYQPESKSLDVYFHKSETRVYHEVPPAVVETLVNAQSPGWYYTRNIKGCYPLYRT